MSKLVIVESPAKAKTIGKYLGSDYEVTASMGHIRDLPASQLGIDVEHGYTPQYISIKGKEKLIKELKSKAKHSDGVLLATDPDREGEAISWHLANILGLDPHEPNRVTFDEITKKGVQEGMAHPRAIDEDLFNAQQARRVLDRLVGYKLSPFLWRKVRRGLSAGRVQSVAVRLIDDREKEIEGFKPEEYWNVDATLGVGHKSFTARLASDDKGKKLLPHTEAEARAITDMQKTGKPFVVLVNTQSPGAAPAEALCAQLRSEYGVQALAMDCMHMQTQDIGRLLEAVMYAFPVEELRFFLPSWVRALPDGHPVKAALYDAMLERAGALTSLSEAESVLGTLQELEPVDEFRVREVDLGTGTVSCELHLPQALFYEELSRQAGVEIADDEALLQMLQELAQTKKLYDKVQTALEQVKATGYGIVMPGAEELKLEKPEIVKKNGNYAVKLRASAPSIHMLRAQIETEISPMVGGEQESQQLIDYLLGEYEEDTDKLWQSNIFGKSLYELVSEGVTAKIMRMPDDARQKLTKTLGRMINENTGGMICILL